MSSQNLLYWNGMHNTEHKQLTQYSQIAVMSVFGLIVGLFAMILGSQIAPYNKQVVVVQNDAYVLGANTASVDESDPQLDLISQCYSDLLPPGNCSHADKLKADINDDGVVNQIDYNLYIRQQ